MSKIVEEKRFKRDDLSKDGARAELKLKYGNLQKCNTECAVDFDENCRTRRSNGVVLIMADKKSKTSSTDKRRGPHFYSLKRLKLVDFESRPLDHLEIKRSSEEEGQLGMQELSSLYLQFVKAIDLSSGVRVVRELKMNVFTRMFSGMYNDSIINTFIERIIEEPLLMDKNERLDFYNLILILFFYCRRIDKTRYQIGLRNKIVRYKHFNFICNIEYDFVGCGDPEIDLIILKSAIRTHEPYKESLLLNYFYTNYLQRRRDSNEIFYHFQIRLSKNIENVGNTFALSFIKMVFLHNTVIYDIIKNEQVLRVVYSFYNKKSSDGMDEKNRMLILKFSEKLMDILYQEDECVTAIIEETMNLRYEDDKYRLAKLPFILRSYTSLDEYSDLISGNMDSFNVLNKVLKNVTRIVSVIKTIHLKPSSLIEITQAIFQIIDRIKPGFINHLGEYLVEMLITVFTRLNVLFKNEEEVGECNIVALFGINKNGWNNLSKLILRLQRCETGMVKDPKKKKVGVRTDRSHLSKNVELLINRTRTLEEQMKNVRDKFKLKHDLVMLKNRSFEIVEGSGDS